MARRLGIEPRLAGPEPAVLPLDDLRAICTIFLLIIRPPHRKLRVMYSFLGQVLSAVLFLEQG